MAVWYVYSPNATSDSAVGVNGYLVDSVDEAAARTAAAAAAAADLTAGEIPVGKWSAALLASLLPCFVQGVLCPPRVRRGA